ncbi:MAG: AMIN domain-containing protein, partial [Gammaproteobacteria bacterium]|nr:AMIN domain-containing protein [Gammaproteobacteria bacterium]
MAQVQVARRVLFVGAVVFGLWVVSALTAFARAAELSAVQLHQTQNHIEVALQLDEPVAHHIFQLLDPHRVVIDMPQTVASKIQWPAGIGPIERIRGGQREGDTTRVVLDLKQDLNVNSRWMLDQLVISLPHDSSTSNKSMAYESSPATTVASVASLASSERSVVIAVDAGHGGRDPGAVGKRQTREKDVVLAIAKRLANKINDTPGMKAVLTRSGDQTLRLRDRIDFAREQKADLFISIHADAFHRKAAKGASVYVLSSNGASSEAAHWLAEQENAADLVTGLSLRDKDETLASVLLDLSQSATIDASVNVAERVLDAMADTSQLHKHQVQHAGFMVLKSPDIPSLLIETAFISNPDEERKLKDSEHQQRLANAIFVGVQDYFIDRPPPGTYFAKLKKIEKYTVSNGDT